MEALSGRQPALHADCGLAVGTTKEHKLNNSAGIKKQNAKRKIMLIHTGASDGGVDVYLANLVSLLKEEADLSIFCSNPEGRAKLVALGAAEVSIPWAVSNNRILNLLFFALYMPVLRFKTNIDTFWPQGGLGALLVPWARVLGFHTVLTRHSAMNTEELGGWRGLRHRLIEAVVWKALRVAHRVICVSETVAKGLRGSIPQDRIVVIPNWVPVPNQSRQIIPELRTRTLNVLFVGRLEIFKGGTLLIDALRRVNQQGTTKASLTIVGEGQCRDQMERLAEGLPVEFAGFQADPAPFYQRADLFVNPSTNPCEGMPLTSLEAMSHGLPCIFSDIPQNCEIVGSEPAALLFRTGDVIDLSAKLEMCANSCALLEGLGRSARKVISERFCPDVASHRYSEALGLV